MLNPMQPSGMNPMQGGPASAPQMPQAPQPPQAPQGLGAMQGMQQPLNGLPTATPTAPVVPPPQQDPDEQDDNESDAGIKKFIGETNIAEHLDEDKLKTIGTDAYEGYMADMESRRNWEQNLDTWTKLAIQVKEEKTWPWPKASNVQYPLLSTAAQQFSARAYPTLVPSDGQVVKAKVIGYDPQGQKAQRAERVGKHMSYQVMEKMPDWENDMDKLLIVLPIVGTCFKKSYWDSLNKEIRSKLVLPKDLVVNYWSSSLETCERKTERIHMPKRLIQERVNAKLWCDIDLKASSVEVDTRLDRDRTEAMKPTAYDETTPYLILEQHTYLDLDDDDYPEPYIVTFEHSTKQVLRITARFDNDGVQTDASGKIIKIDPVEYYTKYGFIPNPDGGFYDLGFGLLLGPLNEAVNTIINELIDSGTLSNLQSGFIAKGLRIKMGETRFIPGEWKAVNSTADDLRKQIVPLPVREPSNVLFELLGQLITSAKELASVAEIFVGKMPGQNTPATTTMATVEQGMKVFTAIYKRIYRALDSEFRKLYRLNRIYFDPSEESEILDVPCTVADYQDKGYDICPAADPQAVSSSEKVTKFQSVMQLMQFGTLDPMQVTLRGLQALEIANPQELMRKGPPPPDPKTAALQQEAQINQQEAQLKAQLAQQKQQADEQHQQRKQALDAQQANMEMQIKTALAQLEMQKKQVELIQAGQQGQQDLQANAQTHAVKLKQMDEVHAKKMAQETK